MLDGPYDRPEVLAMPFNVTADCTAFGIIDVIWVWAWESSGAIDVTLAFVEWPSTRATEDKPVVGCLVREEGGVTPLDEAEVHESAKSWSSNGLYLSTVHSGGSLGVDITLVSPG